MKSIIIVCACIIAVLAWAIQSDVKNHRRVESDWNNARELTIVDHKPGVGHTTLLLAGTDSVVITGIQNPDLFRGSIRYIIRDSTMVYIRYYNTRGQFREQRSRLEGDYLLPPKL